MVLSVVGGSQSVVSREGCGQTADSRQRSDFSQWRWECGGISGTRVHGSCTHAESPLSHTHPLLTRLLLTDSLTHARTQITQSEAPLSSLFLLVTRTTQSVRHVRRAHSLASHFGSRTPLTGNAPQCTQYLPHSAALSQSVETHRDRDRERERQRERLSVGVRPSSPFPRSALAAHVQRCHRCRTFRCVAFLLAMPVPAMVL